LIPTAPDGNATLVVISSGGEVTLSENACEAVAIAASVTWTVKLKVPGAVGVPCRIPVDALRVSGVT